MELLRLCNFEVVNRKCKTIHSISCCNLLSTRSHPFLKERCHGGTGIRRLRLSLRYLRKMSQVWSFIVANVRKATSTRSCWGNKPIPAHCRIMYVQEYGYANSELHGSPTPSPHVVKACKMSQKHVAFYG